MNVNELLDTIEDALEESANVPLSGGKRIVDVEQIRDYLDEVRAALPAPRPDNPESAPHPRCACRRKGARLRSLPVHPQWYPKARSRS